MSKKDLVLFQGNQIRRHWDDQKELWYFSIADVVRVLTKSVDALAYWRKLKERLSKEGGNETVTKCHALKMVAADGKMRLTDVADTETMLRIIQSIPSPNAEPFKLWLAKVGYERLEETADPELAINRALQTYLQKGYSRDWINQRLKSIEIRKQLTDEWEERGVKKGVEFAILTDEISRAWAGLTTKQYKSLKGLKKENLRDHMTNLELVLNMLAETATTEISQRKKPKTFPENKTVARDGGTVAGNARIEIESKTGTNVITKKNAKTTILPPIPYHPVTTQITDLLTEHGMWFETFEHEPVRTSEEAAQVRDGYTIRQGAKALIARIKISNSEKKFVMLVVPGDVRFDVRKVKTLLGAKDLRFATEEEVAQVTGGVLPGGVPPFGNLFDIEVIADPSIFASDRIIFNAGDRSFSVGMKSVDYRQIVNPRIEKIV